MDNLFVSQPKSNLSSLAKKHQKSVDSANLPKSSFASISEINDSNESVEEF